MYENEFEFKAECRQEREKQKEVTFLERLRKTMDKGGHKHDNLSKKIQQAVWAREDLLKSHPHYVNASIGDKIRYVLIVTIPFCAYFFNVLLISQPADYLVRQNVKNPLIAPALVLLVPLLFVIFELAMATLISAVLDEDKPSLGYFNRIVVWITPTLLLATNIAHYRNQGSFGITDLLLLVALFVLAVITDSILVKGAKPIRESVGFVWYSISYYRLNADFNRLELQAEKAFLLVGETFDRYATTLKNFNDTHPKSPIILPPFNEITEKVIQKWLASKYKAA